MRVGDSDRSKRLADEYEYETGNRPHPLDSALNPGVTTGYEKWLRQREEREEADMEAERREQARAHDARQREVEEEVLDRRATDSAVAQLGRLRGEPVRSKPYAGARGGTSPHSRY